MNGRQRHRDEILAEAQNSVPMTLFGKQPISLIKLNFIAPLASITLGFVMVSCFYNYFRSSHDGQVGRRTRKLIRFGVQVHDRYYAVQFQG